ncbi:MAG: hypothetical protein K2J20_03275 [Bacilli bacterium]|nr:hypothetical protein [Bacilli bacterium]
MKMRMEKYYEEETNSAPLRQQKNEKLYENIGNYEVEDYKLETNVTVLDNDARNIDVEHIKKILDTRYNRGPKRRSIVIEESVPEENISLDDTKEYDLNAVLEHARSEKEADYEKERVKKLRDTQYDILNSLDISDAKDNSVKPSDKDAHNELMELINTITMREEDLKKQQEEGLNPLDILTDLKGSDDTIIIGGIHEEESINETSPIMSLEEAEKIKPTIKNQQNQELTSTLQFTQSDFDDFDDLKKEVKSNRALLYAAIVLVSLVLIAGLVIFLNKFLNLSLF